MSTITLSNGDTIQVAELDESLLGRSWSRLAGRVVSVKSPTFSDILDLATEIAGKGAFAPDPSDYRKQSLRRLKITEGATDTSIGLVVLLARKTEQ